MNKIKFLGTAGARFVVTKQLRKSGGLWIKLDDTNVLIDPGPGSLVNCLSSRPKLDPKDLDGIILTHRHIDQAHGQENLHEAMFYELFSQLFHQLHQKVHLKRQKVLQKKDNSLIIHS